MNCLKQWLGKGADEKVGRRLAQYQRRERIILWTGAGLAAIVALFTAIEFTRESDLPVEILPVVPVAVVFGGGCFALSRVQFEWAAEVLKRGVEDQRFGLGDNLPDDCKEWPVMAELWYRLQLLVTVFAGIWIAVMAIWSAVLGPAATTT